MSQVTYRKDELRISIPTPNAPATHSLLMRALAIAIKDLKPEEDEDIKEVLTELQLSLIPGEMQLAYAHK